MSGSNPFALHVGKGQIIAIRCGDGETGKQNSYFLPSQSGVSRFSSFVVNL